MVLEGSNVNVQRATVWFWVIDCHQLVVITKTTRRGNNYKFCSNINECGSTTTHDCDAKQTCIDTPGSYECVCLDQHVTCPEWQRGGECEKNPGWMLLNCKNSCKVCEHRAACANNNNICEFSQKQGECVKNPNWMNVHCAKSCNKC